ncbi:hypothetical protein FRB96_001740 [Tulasnella sp. 330]|nr:hypothetical protein FRB96_001740 [Tulasnella sp. 330]KAG8875959.1 hypothetical protein FRB98_007516 [Tulasnella sp. 332]
MSTAFFTAALEWIEHHPILAISLWITAYIWFKVINYMVIAPYCSPMQDLPGPPKPGKFLDFQHINLIMNPNISHQKQQEMREEYGMNIRIQGFGYWDQRLLTFDTKAITYILSQATELYPKPWQTRRMLCRLLGDGVPFTEGDQHKRQRKVINPAFAPQALRNCYPIFHTKAAELRDRWTGLINGSQTDSTILDMHHWLTRASFDTFAAAGFGMKLDAIQNEDNELYLAYQKMFDVTLNKGLSMRGMLEILFPWLDWVCPDAAAKQVKKSKEIIKKAAEATVKTKRDAIVQAMNGDFDAEKSVHPRSQKDLLSLMIKSNLSESSKLSDTELISQIHSLLFVGSDNTALSICWTLYYLSLNPAIQTRLRDELLPHAPVNSSSTRDISQFPFLDAVVKESIRLTGPIHSTIRVASCDDTIPTEDGVGVKIHKGEFIHLPFEALSLAKETWGEDAWEYNPDRWSKLPEAAKRIPGIITGLATFSVGSHSCPGAQFAIMEAKTFIAELITSFEFLPAPEKKIFKNNIIMTRPFVSGEASKGPQLPMIVRPYTPSTATKA